ncbi:MAG: hypothetical protein E7316_09070 [Clostridiales bacterium]|nr:hypothetical protein [Clostridiales bacterium]
MRDYRLILGLTLRNRLAALRAGSWRKDNGRIDVGRIAASVVVILALVLLAGVIIFAEVKLFGVLKIFNQAALLPALALLLSLLSTLLLSFFHVLSGLYFSRDTVWMAYLPVRSRSVMAAKMTEIWMGEELFSGAILLPVFILYGIHLQAGALYYVRMALIVLLAPVLPLCIVAFLTTLLSRVTSLVRNKEALSVVLSIVLLGGILALESTLLPRIPDDADTMFFVRLLLDNEGILNLLTGAFPPVEWGIHGLQGNWGEFALYIGCCAGAVALMLFLLGGGYLNVCLKQQEQGTRKRRLRTGDATWRQRSPLMALFRKEWLAVIKSPTVAFNCLPGIFMFPLMIVMAGAGIASSMDIHVLLGELRTLVAGMNALDLALIVGAAVGFSSFINPAASTAVSREGSRLEISRMIPVSARTQMTAKLMIGMLIDLMAVAVAAAIFIALLPGQLLAILLGSLLALLLCYASSALNLTLDAVRPNLTWTNEVQVVKQGANVAFGMLMGLALFILPVIPPFLLLGAAPAVRFAAAVAVLALEAAFGLVMFRLVAEKRFAVLEPAS